MRRDKHADGSEESDQGENGQPERLTDDERLARSGLLAGLEALPTVVIVLDRKTLRIAFANPSAEAMLDISRRQLAQRGGEIFPNANELASTITAIGEERFHATHLDTVLDRPGREPLHVRAIVGFLETAPDFVLVELFENERQSRTDREERIHDLTAVNKQLIRNLAHEIKNPLGGIRGAANCSNSSRRARARRVTRIRR